MYTFIIVNIFLAMFFASIYRAIWDKITGSVIQTKWLVPIVMTYLAISFFGLLLNNVTAFIFAAIALGLGIAGTLFTLVCAFAWTTAGKNRF